MYLKFFIIIINSVSCFILPQFVREWHVIGIENNINKIKPYAFNIGKLPMILWYNNNEPQSTINICKHLGATLNNGIINDGCLICPNHFTKYDKNNTVGNVISKNGLLWWSYKSYSKSPPTLFKMNNTCQSYIDINVNLVNVILEFVYSANIIKVNNVHNKYYFTEDLYNAKHRYYYKYPYILKGSINKNVNYLINFLPLDDNKTRIYITTNNKIFIKYFLNNKLNNLKNYNNNNNLKNMLILKDESINNYMKKIYLSFDKYSFPNDFTVSNFYKYRQFY